MSMRLWPALACLLALFALPASAAARVHHGSTGYESDESYYPGDYDGYGEDWPGDDSGGGTIVGAAPQAPSGPVAPTPAGPGQGAPCEPTPAPEPPTPVVPLVSTGTVPGKVAMMRADGKAAIPRGAPAR